MKLKLYREPSTADTTFGVMVLDGQVQCYTLENSHKIIPLGTYPVTRYPSPRNKMDVPLLGNVFNRSMIEIHPANFFHELEGCIALGTNIQTRPMLSNSRVAFDDLMKKLDFTGLTIEIVML